MSISSELLTLQNTKTAIRTAINNKGGSVGASDTFASYATAIDNLPSGGDNSTLIDLIERDITSITIPSGTTRIGGSAFSNCTGLTSITIPSYVTSIADYAFTDCRSLTSVNITDLAAWCNIQIGNSYSSPLEFAHHLYLNGSEITNLTIPNSVTNVKQYTFSKCTGLTSVVIPNNVTTISTKAFNECTGLTSVTIGNSLTTISNYGFYGCTSLTKVILPSTMTSLGMYAFNGCSNLTCVVFQGTTPPSVNNSLYGTYPIYVPAASVDAYKAATNWSTYASRIFAIEQVATVDGNPVYNYELGNIDSTTILSTELVKMPTGTSIEFAEGITNMGGSISGYTTVTLPSTFATFNDQNMIGSSVTTLTMKSTTPPTAERNNLGGAGLTAIYVPASAVDTYKAASGWSNFASIIEGIPGPTPSVTSITFSYNDGTSPGDWGELEGCSETVNVDSFEAASANSTFDSDIKAADLVAVEDNLGNDVTTQCTFSSNDYSKWDSTQDPSYDGESEAYYEWRLDTNIEDADAQNPHSATITATYGNLSDTFTIEWTTTSNCEEPEPDPEEPEE